MLLQKKKGAASYDLLVDMRVRECCIFRLQKGVRVSWFVGCRMRENCTACQCSSQRFL